MKTRTLFAVALASTVALSACSLPKKRVVHHPVVVAEAGPKPTMEEARAAVRENVSSQNLRDPDSARIKNVTIGQPVEVSPFYTGANRTLVAWPVGFDRNAKNAYGAYTGYKHFELYIAHGVSYYTVRP